MTVSIVYTPTFNRGFKSLSSNDRDRVKKALEELASLDDPRRGGDRKHGPLRDLYAYSVGQQIRILYAFVDGKLVLLRVGSHSAVYK
ncbi:MAG: type II toxin-antitoxin system RelE family toxin [Nitrososphaerales archaeon]